MELMFHGKNIKMELNMNDNKTLIKCNGYPLTINCKNSAINMVGNQMLCDECAKKMKADLNRTVLRWRFRR